MIDHDRHIIATTATLLEALGRLNALPGGAMTLLATDADGRLAGTLTDGDVRRALLAGLTLGSTVGEAMHRHCRRLTEGDIRPDLLRAYRNEGITLLPVVDADGRPVRIIDTRVTRTILPVKAVLMAGGKGERLRPLTLDTPKPLLMVGDRPIIDYNIRSLARVGVTDVTVTLNYLAEQLEAHFAEPVEGLKVKTVREPAFMGTIGSVALTDAAADPDGTTLVMNSDLLTDISLEDMYLRHAETGADITIAAIPYVVSVPYAVMVTEGRRVESIEEKPSMSYYANAGIYMISNRLLQRLPQSGRTDATDLIEQALAEGRFVGWHPVNGTWIDIGSPADYRHACDLMKNSILLNG